MMSNADYRERCLSQKINACNVCGSSSDLRVHHIDGDRTNNALDNLIPLCRSCHAKVHTTKRHGKAIDRLTDKLKEAGYLDTKADSKLTTKMVNLPDETRDELRKYKAEYGDTYGEAVERLLQDSGWYDE